jgi:hypothetical protein
MGFSDNISRNVTSKVFPVFILILVLLFLSSAITANAAALKDATMSGWISDAKCGAKMTGYCAKACITSGEKPVFITVAKEVLAIANPDATKGYEGERVTVKGSVEEGKLTITSIALNPPKK